MTISTKGRYALRMMLDLALHAEDGFISLKDTAQQQEVSKKYLEQIVPVLTKAGLLTANRGFQGGYKLSRPASEYTVGEIIRLTEGSLAPVACLQTEINDCPRKEKCITLPIWEGLYKVIAEYFDNITLQQIIDIYSTQSEKAN